MVFRRLEVDLQRGLSPIFLADAMGTCLSNLRHS